jgi:hypothetical protein
LHIGGWLATLITRLLDLIGLPELIDFIWRTASHVSPLTGAEIAVASRVLGPTALRWADVRVAQGGLLGMWYRLRGSRLRHLYTINLPGSGPHARRTSTSSSTSWFTSASTNGWAASTDGKPHAANLRL